jgi:hypothetical protein
VAAFHLFVAIRFTTEGALIEEVTNMANKTLFKSLFGKLIPATNAVNEEHAPAYALPPKHQLAQYAATGCLNATF